MRKPYKRAANANRKWFYGGCAGFIAVFLAFIVFEGLRNSSSLADPGQLTAWVSLIAFSLFGIAVFLLILQGPRAEVFGRHLTRHAPNSPNKWEQFPRSHKHAVVLIPILFYVLGWLYYLRENWQAMLVLGVPSVLFLVLPLWRDLRRRGTLTITELGIHVPWRSSSLLRWSEIKEIVVRPNEIVITGKVNMTFDDPENDQVEIVLKPSQAEPQGSRLWKKFRDRWRSGGIFIKPWEWLGVSPTVLLDAIDSFRPENVPIRDPRQIENDGTNKM